jgi:hypothetical protein
MSEIIRVEPEELRKSYIKIYLAIENHLSNNSQLKHKTPHCLLFFYAIECAVKYCWMRKENLCLSPLPQVKDNERHPFYSHSLDPLIKDLQIPANNLSKYQRNFHLTGHKSSKLINFSQLHQVWRYGIVIKPEDEISAVEYLKQIGEYLEQRWQLR